MTRTSKQIALFSLLVAADQISKWWIQKPDFHPFTVIDGFFNIIRAYNPGVAFSMFSDLPDVVRIWLLLGVTIGIAERYCSGGGRSACAPASPPGRAIALKSTCAHQK